MVLETIVKWLIPVVLGGLLTYITTQVHNNKNSNYAMKESMVLLLRSQIVGKCEKYIDLGYLPDYARSCLEDLFKQYETLGGNHGVNKLVEQCFELPPVKKGEK